jgi:uncharacterized protein
MPNRLANETSPYLLQHKDNPVDWYPWGSEAFEKARAQGKPILLSVGYSACHWCHVMAHESFENPAVAALMNQWFVNVKVDREERPDVDAVYMSAVQALTGQGGWPMTVFLTAEGKPFYAGTYFPPEDGNGRPGFPRVLESIHEKWEAERDQILGSAETIAAHLRAASERRPERAAEITSDLADRAVQVFRDTFDAVWGGFGQAPKFPSPSNLEFLLAYHARTGKQERVPPGSLELVLHTLHRMATGGMFDQLGGGFARYSVDERWLVPHFEKMLYDNAQLARLYLHAFQVTGDPECERIARETLTWMGREMLDHEGGFYAALDADSEGIEGRYYVWTAAEIEEALGEDAALFSDWFGVTEEGNFRDPHHPELVGRNVLTHWQDPEVVAAQFGLTVPALEEKLVELRAKVLAVRERRVPPGLDDKVLTSWNGLAIAAFAEAGRMLGEPAYLEIAERTAAFLKQNLWRDGRLLHTYKAGRAAVDGMLEDHVYVGLGLVELFKATGQLAHLTWATELFEAILANFHDDEHGGFFETPKDGEALLLRQKPLFDGPTPSGNAAAALLGLWLSRYQNRPEWEAYARQVFGLVHDHAVQGASGFGALWLAVEFTLARHRELVISGELTAREPFEREAGRRYLPFVAIAPTSNAEGPPLFEGRRIESGAQAFVCEDMVCKLPASDVAAFRSQLDALLR